MRAGPPEPSAPPAAAADVNLCSPREVSALLRARGIRPSKALGQNFLVDFNDTLKSVSHGYASLDYVPSGYQRSDIVRMDILLNGDAVDAFACMVHRDRARARGKEICAALKDAIPPHMFKIPVQAAVGGTIVAREDIRPFRKDVTAKLYGGDITRKMKLLNKQKEGKKRMKQFGTVNVPQEAFVAVLRSGANEDSK